MCRPRKCEFRNVHFAGVVFSKEQEMEADFSDEARENRLRKARVDNLDLEDEDEMPLFIRTGGLI